MPSFKVPCPSCEARVLIKNPDLIGSKVECPKCKYRFKVEPPADETPSDEPKAAKPTAEKAKKKGKGDSAAAETDTPKVSTGKKDKSEKKPKKEKKPGNPKNKKVLLGAGLGVLAVGLLAVGGIVMFGGDDKKPAPFNPGPRPMGSNTVAQLPPDTQTQDGQPEGKGELTKPKPKAAPLPRSDKDPTNLLPGAAVSVMRFDIDRLRQTPIGGLLFDNAMSNLFRTSLAIEPLNVSQYFHCVVGEQARAPFGMIRLREPVAAHSVTATGAGPAKTVNGRALHPVKGNPFLAAVGNALAARSLFADLNHSAPDIEPAGSKGPTLGLCVYDTQTILLGDFATLEKYLNGLTKDGYPVAQTIYRKASPPPPPAQPKDTAMPPMGPTGPTPKGPAAKGPATGQPGPTETPRPAPATPPSAPVNKDFTSNPHYLSVSPELKKLLNSLEDDGGESSLILIAEKFNDDAYDRKAVKDGYKPVAKIIDPILGRIQFLGLNFTAFTPRQFTATVRLAGKTADDARHIVRDDLTPALLDWMPILALFLNTPLELRNQAAPNANASNTPGGPGIPGSPGGPESPMGPLGPGDPNSATRSTGQIFLPGLSYPITAQGLGTGMNTPGGPGGFPGPGGPGGPMGPGQTTDTPRLPANILSHIDLRLTDQFVTLTVDITWVEETYAHTLAPRLFGFANQLKGKAAVFAGNNTRQVLAQAITKYVEVNKKFPSGTIPRPASDPIRLGLPYPPVQRLSLFAELLPYIPGREGIASSLNRAASWYDESKMSRNAETAGSWVPELLVSYYPPAAWRATTPLAPNYTFGGTNFVAVAGIGADAARFDPTKPEQAKLVGISGYDWGSTVAEITDGPANTIFLLQVPPGFARPWAAGGGATVIGLDPDKPMDSLAWDHPDGKGGTKRGTYAIMGDGAIRWLPESIDPKVLRALVTRAGGEKVPDLDTIAPRVDAAGNVVELKAASPAKPEPPKNTPPVKAENPPKNTPAAGAEVAPAPRAK